MPLVAWPHESNAPLLELDSCDLALRIESNTLSLSPGGEPPKPRDEVLHPIRVTNALSALGATHDAHCADVVHVKMPLHYHNRIVKDRTANSLLELAKP